MSHPPVISEERQSELMDEFPEWIQKKVNAYLSATIKARQEMVAHWQREGATELETVCANICSDFESGKMKV